MSDEFDDSGARITSSVRKWVTPVGVSRFLAFRPDRNGLSVDLVRGAVRTANGHSQERAGGEAARGDVAVAVGQEVHVRLAAGGDRATRDAWLEDLAAALPAGDLTRPNRDSGPDSALQELLTLRPVTAFLGQRPGADGNDLVSALLDGFETGATAYFAAAEAGMAVDRADLPALFGTLEFAPEVTFVHEGRVRGNVARSLTSASRYERGTTWRDELASARATLERAAPQLDVGFVRRASAYTRWGDAHLDPPTWPCGNDGLRYLLDPAWWGRRVPDAHGLQLVTATHLERATDLSAWEVMPIGDRFLLAARDPGPWFADDQPDPETLARARHDLGAMLVTAHELVP
jgi:hypothetical protein